MISVTPSVQTDYRVVVTDANACPATATMTIMVNSLPQVSITPGSSAVCEGNSTTLTATAGYGENYSWMSVTTGEALSGNTNTITVTPTGPSTTYAVVVTQNGCSNTATVTVSVNNPTVTLNNITGQTTVLGE